MTRKKDEWVTITEAAETLQCKRSAFSELFLGPSWWCRRVDYMPSKYGWRWELSSSFVASLPELCRGYGLTMKHIRAAVRRLDSEQYADATGLKEQIKGYKSVLKSEVARLESALTVQSSYLYDFKETMDSLQKYKEQSWHLEDEVTSLKRNNKWLEDRLRKLSERHNEAKKQTEATNNEPDAHMLTMYDAAAASNRSVATIRRWIRAGDLTRHEGAAPAKGGSRCVLVDREELFTLLADRNQSAQKFATVNGTTSEHKAQIEGLKTRLAAAEKERDQANARRSSHAKARDKWAADHARQKKEIEGLKTRVKAAEKERDHWKTEAIEDRTLAKEWERKHTHAVRQESQAKNELDEARTRLTAAEKGRDQAIADAKTAGLSLVGRRARIERDNLRSMLEAAKKERDQAITARDKWAADHARQTNQIGALEARLVREARAYKQLRTDNEALKLEIQTYADTCAEAHPPAVIDRLVAAVESAPLGALMQIDKPRHAALRRVVHLWTAVQHAVEQFTPGDCAQTNNNDEVT